MIIIGASIDLSKIDKSKIVEGKNGAKYYNFTAMVNDSVNQWGKDVSLTQEQTQEQREAKEPKVFIGGGKTVWNNAGSVAKDKSQYDPNGGEYKVERPSAQNEQFSQGNKPFDGDTLPFQGGVSCGGTMAKKDLTQGRCVTIRKSVITKAERIIVERRAKGEKVNFSAYVQEALIALNG